jgi:hypothetical protein
MFALFAVLSMMVIRLVIPVALMLVLGSLVQRRMNNSQTI